jgi:hypothetical protein
MAKYSGSGWHFQSERHANARRTGHAGGKYQSERIRKIINKHPEYKNLTFEQLRGKGIFLKYKTDNDKDGVKNIHDCRPLNHKAQDDGRPAGWYDIGHDETNKPVVPEKKPSKFSEKTKKVGAWISEEAKKGEEIAKKEYEAIKAKIKANNEERERKKRLAVARAVAEATKQKVIDEKTVEETKKLVEEISEEKEIKTDDSGMINTIAQNPEEAEKIVEKTTKAMTKINHSNINDLAETEVSELSDGELQKIAVRLGTGFWGAGNKYENEIKRRIKEREKIKTDLIIELEKAQTESKKRLTEIRKEHKETTTREPSWANLFK